jgi:CubicO group peptidase (beta-lactamase class C family)
MIRAVRLLALLAVLPWGGVAAQASRRDEASTYAAAPARIAAGVAEITKRIADAREISGVILIARGHNVVFRQAYGSANWESLVPISSTTRFGIGSITKPMTEILVNTLAEEGRLDLDAPVDRYLSAFPRGPSGKRPTIRDLLTHKAGVPHRVTTALDETRSLNPADIVERVRASGLLFEPGSQELYSSAGYTCLARIIELVEGRPFAQVIKSRIFEPARMSSALEETGEQLMPGRAAPYHLGIGDGRAVVENEPYQNLSFLSGAGSTYATATDMLRFVRAMRAGTLGAAARKELLGDTVQAWHSWYGRTNGYEASVDFRASDDVTVVFLSNLRSAANWQVRGQIKHALDGDAPTTIGIAAPAAAPFEDFSTLPGTYGTPDNPVPVDTADGKLIRDGDEVYPTSDGWYYMPTSGSLMRFHRDASGAADAMITRLAGKETSKPRMAVRAP